MNDNDGVPQEDLASLRLLAAALPGRRIRAVVVFGELRVRHEVTDTTVKVRMVDGRYAWVWDDGEPEDTEVIDADPGQAGYVAAVAARICKVLGIDPARTDRPTGM